MSKVRLELRKPEDQEQEQITPGMIKETAVTVGGREIPLYYDLRAQIEIDEELEMTYDELNEKLRGKKPNTKLTVQAIRILGNRALVHGGGKADLTDDWLIEHISPKDMAAYKVALMAAIMTGWFMETDDSWNERQDVTLNEILKKKEG